MSAAPTMPTQPANFLTVTEAAKELHASPRSIYRAIARGELRAASINGRGDLRIYRPWLMDFMERRAAHV